MKYHEMQPFLQKRILVVFLTVSALSHTATTSKTDLSTLPDRIKQCFNLVFGEYNKDADIRKKHKCLELLQQEGLTKTQEDINYIRSLIREIYKDSSRRHKRHIIGHQHLHVRERWTRKEVRRMSEKEFEFALRREVPDVSIPYWDTSLDYEMADPRKSILWTDRFFGNGNGVVNSGPFVWRTSQGDELLRNVGSGGTLISKEFVELVLSRKSHVQIFNENDPDYWLEGYHDDVHVWVDGHLSVLDSAAEDPVFWFLHAFIDYWWQLFMNKQIHELGIFPYTDYPTVRGDHNALNMMDPFNITNVAGYRQQWYYRFYKYQRSPTCNRYHPDCGSHDLSCNITINRCVSVEGNITSENVNDPTSIFAQLPLFSQFSGHGSAQLEGERQVVGTPLLPAGRRFSATKTDPRTIGQNRLPQVTNGHINLVSEKAIAPVQPRGISFHSLNNNKRRNNSFASM
ncbi:hypothetical protein KUTeg_019273 [Tegillarca granosa]|uniref:Tyrosinase copper-binding domain-containing protein n=1 Tax=Tegillarca granosa TaxID=220873 RepID=A0ABQ9EH21_TEGGR|nr:hypothetical protein KUTeg_019273 [Tegillarca granosa]